MQEQEGQGRATIDLEKDQKIYVYLTKILPMFFKLSRSFLNNTIKTIYLSDVVFSINNSQCEILI